MTRSALKLLIGLLVAFAVMPLVLPAAPVWAQDGKKDDPAFLSFGAGYYDFNRRKETGAEFRVEYRSDKKFAIFKPLPPHLTPAPSRALLARRAD